MTDSQFRRVDALFEKLRSISDYPEGVIPVRARIPRTAFFPGGNGLLHAEQDIPVGKVMVLGHNFDSEKGFEKSLARGEEKITGATWRNLLDLLGAVNISPLDCFFTNAYMGIKQGDEATGKFPGAKSPQFIDACQKFLIEQIKVQLPKLIVTLGNYVPAFIAPLSKELASWRDCESVTKLDAMNRQLVSPVHFSEVAEYTTTIAALTHPSFRRLNVKHRKYNDATGNDAELALLKDAVLTSGLQIA